MSSWLAWTDAIALAAVLPGSADAAAVPPRAGRRPDSTTLRRACAALRDELGRTMAAASAAAAAECDGSERGAAAVAPWRRRTAALQRTMDSRIATLRRQARAVLAAGTPRLQDLAALDAVLENALRGRERHLLGTLPGLLESHSRRAGCDARAAAAAWQRVMQAELDLRLQPVEGLLDALDEEGSTST